MNNPLVCRGPELAKTIIMADFALLLKPVSFDCNLRCSYCFYLAQERHFGSGKHIMSDQVLEEVIANYLGTKQQEYSFAWQGGEPTLAGVDFFYRAMAFMQKHGAPGANIGNVLQTNGTLLNLEWCCFFKKYNFLLGVSLDGPEYLHDIYRQNAQGAGTHATVCRNLELLRQEQVDFNILTLVNHHNVQRPLELYRYLRDEQQCCYMQFIECIDFAPDGSLQAWSITAQEWGNFLCEIFDEWYTYDRDRVSVRLFDSLLHQLIYNQSNTCAMSRECGQYLLVEHNAELYPCDFFVQQELRLGTVAQPLEDVLASPKLRSFAKAKSRTIPQCRRCSYQRFCSGDCPKNRRNNHSVLCGGWQQFFAHVLERLKEIASKQKNMISF